MATIDIRDKDQVIDTIIFADNGDVEKVKREGSYITFMDSSDDYVMIPTKDIPNLIKALQKAVELGWAK